MKTENIITIAALALLSLVINSTFAQSRTPSASPSATASPSAIPIQLNPTPSPVLTGKTVTIPAQAGTPDFNPGADAFFPACIARWLWSDQRSTASCVWQRNIVLRARHSDIRSDHDRHRALTSLAVMIELPNDCGLVAAAAWKFLAHGVNVRVLSMDCGPVHGGHSVVVFECCSRLRVYDYKGTSNFTQGCSFEDSLAKLAEAYLKKYAPEKQLHSACWL